MLLRDKLLIRLAAMGEPPDYQRLAEEVLGIRGAAPELARKLVAQALVVEDRRDVWRQAGERICTAAPAAPGVYVLRDSTGAVLYVGKAVNLRRRLRTHFAERRWKSMPAALSRAADAEWREVGSDLEALLREAMLIDELQPTVNVQTGAPALDTRAIPRALVRDVLVILPSIESDSAELVAAAADGRTVIQRTRRNGADLVVHAQRLMKFFRSALRAIGSHGRGSDAAAATRPLAPIVFSWLHRQGQRVTRLDPHDVRDGRELRARLAAVLEDEALFSERVDQRRRR